MFFIPCLVISRCYSKLSIGKGIRERKQIPWCTHDGRPSSSACQKPLSFISEASKASADDVVFRDSEFFVAGELHHHYDVWDNILQDFHKRDEVLNYISQGVSVYDFFKPFKGQFKGKYYDSPLPPKMIFENNKICLKFQYFISNCILERVSNGSLSI